MKNRATLFISIVLLASLVAACDNGPTPQPTTPPTTRAVITPQQATGTVTVVDAAPITPQPTPAESLPSPTPVTATSTGEPITVLQALTRLKPIALTWQPDVRLAMLANVRPGQQGRLLGSALGDPDVFEATPGGLGRNWTLVAVSPSRGAMAVSMDGAQIDLVEEGNVTGEMLAGFSGPNLAALDLATLDLSRLVNSDQVAAKSGAAASTGQAGIALIAPDGLGIGPLPTPQAGGPSPTLAYETFSTDPAQQTFIIFDALSGEVVVDSGKP